jgi:nucleotide-binding universal stress UspA family protein
MPVGPIVVPLDGSKLSERALPYAALSADALGARILLVTVWEGADHGLTKLLPGVAEDLSSAAQRYYKQYLAGAAEKLRGADLVIDTEVLAGHPADEIARIVEQQKARLLVLASHGRSGLGRWWYGSVAGDLVRHAPVSTLVIGPKVLEEDQRADTPRSILVPLDGSELSEAAMAPAEELAQKFAAEVVLAQVLSWAGQAYLFDVPQNTVAEIDREVTKAAEEYLAKAAFVSSHSGQDACPAWHAGGNADRSGRPGRNRSVVMTSHGRGGLAGQRWEA